MPADFNRLPRKLDEAERFKATEFRTMLLYTACIIFHKILDIEKYNHFMLLMFAMRIFCDPKFAQNDQYISYGQKLCVLFVKQYPKLYKTDVFYNIHCLIHLADDVRRFGALDSISAFPYETMLGKIKKTVRSSHLPLKQLINRFNEGSLGAVSNATCFISPKGKIAIGSHFINPEKFKDSCVILQNGDIGHVSSMSKNILKFEKFKNKQPAFFYPAESSMLDIYVVGDSVIEIMIHYDDIRSKCFICPFNGKNIVIPLL